MKIFMYALGGIVVSLVIGMASYQIVSLRGMLEEEKAAHTQTQELLTICGDNWEAIASLAQKSGGVNLTYVNAPRDLPFDAPPAATVGPKTPYLTALFGSTRLRFPVDCEPKLK